ncbi:MAG TPA: metallophosphoesterase, partial [Polyangiaceae bacterium]
MRRTVALGDIHLTRNSPASVVDDVARFFDEHRGDRVLFTGDVLDLSADVDAKIDMHPKVAMALAAHLEGGGEIFWVAGNHDAPVAEPGFAAHVARALGVSADAAARFHVSPWFFRFGGIHLEHGHRFDSDNAPAHPLVPDGPSLGVTFVEEFIVPTGAHAYLNANDGTPLDLFVNAFRWYGRRGPYVVAKFFTTAATALRRSGTGFDAHAQILEGAQKQADFASAHGVDENVLESLRGAGAVPTLASRRDTFSR